MPARPTSTSAARQLAGLLAKYEPAIDTFGRAAIRKLRARLPGATALVYDNYNALMVGFGPRGRLVIRSISAKQRPRRPA